MFLFRRPYCISTIFLLPPPTHSCPLTFLPTGHLVNLNSGDAHFFDDSITAPKVWTYLDSPHDHEKIKGLKWILAMISKGKGNAVADMYPAGKCCG